MPKNYTAYFSRIVKENGTPNLATEQFRRMMNIIYLEGKLAGIDQLRQIEGHKYNMQYHDVAKQIAKLTGDLEPYTLFHEMASAEEI